MEWSPQQDQALKAVDAWLHDPSKQLFRLFGYAGSGKTTLAKHFAENVKGLTFFAAYTGKATHVLRQRGCPNASTIHSLIYHPRDKSRERLTQLEIELDICMGQMSAEGRTEEEIDMDLAVMKRRSDIKDEKKNLSRPAFDLNLGSQVSDAELIVVDECSMVDGRMGEDLLSFKKKVLVLGDPAQLPPVGGGGFFTNAEPDFMLTEIHRQARDNPIIYLATLIREGKRPDVGEYGASAVLAQGSKLTPEDLLGFDQLLVGKNVTRRASNRRLRQLHGRELATPEPGDKLVCLRNNHDLGLLNGSLWNTVDCIDVSDDRVSLTVASPDGLVAGNVEVIAHRAPFLGEDLEMAWWDRREAEEFEYGYALTCHKAQGSQFPSVMILDESYVFRDDRFRWLYTAVTRAIERVTIVRM